MTLIPKLSRGIDFTYMGEEEKVTHSFQNEAFMWHSVWLALSLKKADLEGQNVDIQWFEMQSIKMENEEELLCRW